jgi:hypothetical protein
MTHSKKSNDNTRQGTGGGKLVKIINNADSLLYPLFFFQTVFRVEEGRGGTLTLN